MMENFDAQKAILKLVSSNKDGVSVESIIDYLDYINKVRFERAEVEGLLANLAEQNKLFLKNKLWFTFSKND